MANIKSQIKRNRQNLVRHERNVKMAKTTGNVIDPLDVADEFGADVIRFTLAILSSGGDVPLAKNRMQGYAAFATKIGNAVVAPESKPPCSASA